MDRDERAPAADRDEESLDPNRMEVDLGAIVANLRAIRRRLGAECRILATLKADAYGHGVAAVAGALAAEGIDYLAVGSLDDARRLRASGARAPTLLLGVVPAEATPALLALDLIATVDDEASALAVARAARAPAAVCIKVDCGFGRYGVPLDRAEALVEYVRAQPPLRLEGIYTHAPFSDARGCAWAQERMRAFGDLVAALARRGLRPKLTQALASPGLAAGFVDRLGAAAVGHALFGLDPLDEGVSAEPLPLEPALCSITTRLTHRGGSTGGAEAALYLRGRPRTLGVVPFGMAHGYRPALGEAYMLVDGARARVLRVSLESSVLDLGAAGDAAPGAAVVALGAQGRERIALADLARWHASTPLAMAITLGRALPRRYRSR